MVDQQNKSRSSRVTPTNNSRLKSSQEEYNKNNLVQEEKHLKNGDMYVGTFLGKVPHGVGKYLWCDGCMYEGEWKKGKANGKGMLSLPCGETYEGEFKSGRMEGFGTLTCAHGDTYKGAWLACNKHGYGEQWFSNGDYYSGGWKQNLQEGYGKYIWRNGDHYQGEWRNGLISSKGCLVRTNGGRFDGVWDNGAGKTTPCDNSVSSYEPKFASSNLKKTNGGVLQRMCVWESESEAEDITCNINDNEEAAPVFYREKQLTSPCSLIDEVKKPGQAISKGHKNYDLMVNLQLGIRYSIGKCGLESRKLKSKDFNPMEKFWTKFPSEGSKLTPTHKTTDFRWKDYCPWVFRDLRDLFQVDPAEYVSAICENDALRELSSPGKSGCFFYLTQDDKFLIKTVKKSELKVLLRMLPSYYQHVCRYENSLVTKFYGLHCVKPAGGPKTRFIVMGNLFCSEYRIHKRFDLKGSRHGRTMEKAEGEIDETTTLKDLDLDFVFRLPKNWCRELIKQVERDCEFLEAERIMDYSLLIGIHFRNNDKVDKIELSPIIPHGEKAPFKNEKYLLGHHSLEADLQNMDRVLAGRKSLIRLGSNVPARAERLARGSNLDCYIPGGNDNVTTSHNNEIFEVILYSGIIDILQDYDMSKWLEHAYKSLQVDPTSISAVDPKLYSKRFRDFIRRIFVED